MQTCLRRESAHLLVCSGQLKHAPVRRYLHDLSDEMGGHLESISQYISNFNETCRRSLLRLMAAERYAQYSSRYTYHSGHAAARGTQLTQSFHPCDRLLCGRSNNASILLSNFWKPAQQCRQRFLVQFHRPFDCGSRQLASRSSLEASHVVREGNNHCPLILTDISRAPGRHVPWWVISWLRRSPLVFLVSAVSCFSIGLVIFSYSTQVRRC